ncbi:unnamed protein product [Linum trigynum]|uniref:RNase H type-1 domain-containing protein n=1 Tax=Linum trigynum TaxID=586398 RepID=A0AAV2F5V3_9ROSI
MSLKGEGRRAKGRRDRSECQSDRPINGPEGGAHSTNQRSQAWPYGLPNTDGSAIPSSLSSSAGRVIRNNEGRMRLAFTANLGNGSLTRTELMGIYLGLQKAWDAGIRRIEVQTDSTTVIKLIESAAAHHPHYITVRDIKNLMSRD